MKVFIGTKIIKAEPMKAVDFETQFGKTSGANSPDAEGYHVMYPNPDGKEYHSWSPKEVFETAYREATTDELLYINNRPLEGKGPFGIGTSFENTAKVDVSKGEKYPGELPTGPGPDMNNLAKKPMLILSQDKNAGDPTLKAPDAPEKPKEGSAIVEDLSKDPRLS